ncbi:hypothetical protein MRB53_009578 [Persea americana]|uniref:Uncharacterized protein n=1 Tax=Persea americana TaxID=3435 RepID=A0ACC2LPH3_PERAE|nr:hypothetical protein MRB53_009578 [Persea americana]
MQKSAPPAVFHIFKFLDSINSKKFFTSFRPSLTSIISKHIRDEKLDEARRVFEKIPCPDIYQCTMMITGYSRLNRIDEALQLFDAMPVRDVVSWNSMIKGCLSCGNLDLARKLFDEMPERNVISWTTIIDGFAQSGRVEIAEDLFRKMNWRDTAAWNSMIFGYCSNGRIEDARNLFEKMPSPNVISWTTMIGGLDQHGESDKALALFRQMRVSGVEPTSSTYACALTACANICALEQGVQLHAHLVKLGNDADAFVSTSLITLYANCREIEDSRKFFNENVRRNVAEWTALLTGYGLNCKHEDALELFYNMVKAGIKPNQSTFTSALNSCCGLEALDRGKQIHTKTIKRGLDLDVFVGNSLIVMYSKCGNMNDGMAVFDKISNRNLVSWNSVIVGCAQHGYGLRALEFFDQMTRAKVHPDEITFVGLLTACSHCRMLEKGRHFFELLSQDPSIEVKLEHYACMVDILGRLGNLEEAQEFIENMPVKANSMVWLALLSACRVHSNVELAERAARRVFDIEPHSSAVYILLSNIYASCERWNDVSQIRKIMKDRGIVKMPGCSWITLKGLKHEFLSGDRSHPMSKEIYAKLDALTGKLKEVGYVSDKRLALHDVEDEQKEVMLSHHSERLAIAFGLLCTVEGSTITVMKNLRVCGDCHCAIKLITKVVGREIIVRDSSRFHHFRNGACSCRDYW